MIEPAPDPNTIVVRTTRLTVTWRDFLRHGMPILTYGGQVSLPDQRPMPAIVVFRERYMQRLPKVDIGHIGWGSMPTLKNCCLSAIVLYEKNILRQILSMASPRGQAGISISLITQRMDESNFAVADCTVDENFDLPEPPPWPFTDALQVG